GLLVTTFNYCRILDPRTQVVTGLTRNGTFLIENGEIAGAVSNLRFTQSFVEGLSSGRVLGVGNDARMADSEAGPGMTSAPTVHLSEWNFTGGAQG
ncbi:MAG: TldD/PmbA family protein, partial [Acidimicrobiia bacterium]|nr:TldD/PmbA family protein [Acidimicrobiia bacterium]